MWLTWGPCARPCCMLPMPASGRSCNNIITIIDQCYKTSLFWRQHLMLLTIAAADGKCALLTNVRCCKQSKAKQSKADQRSSNEKRGPSCPDSDQLTPAYYPQPTLQRNCTSVTCVLYLLRWRLHNISVENIIAMQYITIWHGMHRINMMFAMGI